MSTQSDIYIRHDDNDNGPHEVPLEEALKLAQGHHEMGNLVIADRTYRDILRAVPDHYPTTLFMGALQYQRGNVYEAEKFLAVTVDGHPDDGQAWLNYGVVLAAKREYERALECFENAKGLIPQDLSVGVNMAYLFVNMERYEDAEAAARDVLERAPEHIDALTNLGISLAEQNKLQAAEEIWQKIIELDPNNVKAYANWANTLRSLARLNTAMEKVLKALSLDEDSPVVWSNMGTIHRDLGALDAAIECYQKAVRLKPDNYEVHHNLAICYAEQENFDEAFLSARYAVAFNPAYSPAYQILSFIQRNIGKDKEAQATAQTAVALDDKDPNAFLALADVLIALGKLDEGEAALTQAINLKPGSARSYLKLAGVQRDIACYEDALDSINKAIDINPQMPILYAKKSQLLNHLSRTEEAWEAIEIVKDLADEHPTILTAVADMYLIMNEKDKAEEYIKKAIELAPDVPGNYFVLSAIHKFTADDPYFKNLLAMREKIGDFNDRSKSVIYYTLGDAFENMKEYEQAFEAYKTANDLRAETISYDMHAAESHFERIIQSTPPAYFKNCQGKGYASDVPIFIVGMPRSGTTLTEQIISSHPDVHPGGELSFASHVTRYEGKTTAANAATSGERYVSMMKALDPTGQAKHITDKMPGNYARMGQIAVMLPNAKIIHCRRNPMDTLLSCYKQNFASGQQWSYTLKALAEEYNRYERLMAYWRKVLPGRFLEISYEDTVTDPEGQARKLIEYVGLEWNDACLEPHKQKRPVMTASKGQVIQPVYKSSVQGWHRYKDQLQEVYDLLENKENVT